MAKEKTSEEKALIQRAMEIKGNGAWGQEQHALLIASEILRIAPEAASKAGAIIALLSANGLGGNCSQFAQWSGMREKSSASSSADEKAQALLKRLGIAIPEAPKAPEAPAQ